MNTNIPQIDKHVTIKPGDIVWLNGYESAIDALISGLVNETGYAQWIRLSDKEYVPSRPEIEVFKWGDRETTCPPPKPNSLIVLDGAHALPDRFRWDPMVGWMKQFAEENQCTWIVLTSDEEEGTRLDPATYLPENVISELRKHADCEIAFAHVHFSDVKCAIRFPTREDAQEIQESLGTPGELAERLVLNVSSQPEG